MSNHAMPAVNEERAERENEHNRALRAAQVTWDEQPNEHQKSSIHIAFHGRSDVHHVWEPLASQRCSFIKGKAEKSALSWTFPWPKETFDDDVLEPFVQFLGHVYYDFRESTRMTGIALEKQYRDVRQAIFHASLYLLFHHFGVHLGPHTAMRKFVCCISTSWNHPYRFMEIVKWVYKQPGPMDLRRELVNLVLERSKELARSSDFQQLMKGNHQFRSELIAEMSLRYTPIQEIYNNLRTWSPMDPPASGQLYYQFQQQDHPDFQDSSHSDALISTHSSIISPAQGDHSDAPEPCDASPSSPKIPGDKSHASGEHQAIAIDDPCLRSADQTSTSSATAVGSQLQALIPSMHQLPHPVWDIARVTKRSSGFRRRLRSLRLVKSREAKRKADQVCTISSASPESSQHAGKHLSLSSGASKPILPPEGTQLDNESQQLTAPPPHALELPTGQAFPTAGSTASQDVGTRPFASPELMDLDEPQSIPVFQATPTTRKKKKARR